ncbi:hypothetical protein N0V83_004741 [Neocucurbitaria cava]|uniref:FAD dependent oxidoreductase domain-containing protein n=1 Tax=Neocucurbitaria cava TaxID=798079 RepID=A0A9W9CNG5_9PLEO|nr:hypothetical protein N0V83_004741 [Neocucurbitaria cava]
MSSALQPSYLIIGAGVISVSTAYHLIKKYPHIFVQFVDLVPYPSQLAASWDWNKVIRADYGNLFCMEKALEALQLWRSDPLLRSYYHESRFFNINNTGLGRRIIENYKKRNAKVDAEMVSPDEFKDIGWAEATKALTAFVDAVVTAGVEYTAAGIGVLTFDEEGD